jgi:hypothetical protein
LPRREVITSLVAQLYAESQQIDVDLERDMTRWAELAERES